eukprot:84564_1
MQQTTSQTQSERMSSAQNEKRKYDPVLIFSIEVDEQKEKERQQKEEELSNRLRCELPTQLRFDLREINISNPWGFRFFTQQEIMICANEIAKFEIAKMEAALIIAQEDNQYQSDEQSESVEFDSIDIDDSESSYDYPSVPSSSELDADKQRKKLNKKLKEKIRKYKEEKREKRREFLKQLQCALATQLKFDLAEINILNQWTFRPLTQAEITQNINHQAAKFDEENESDSEYSSEFLYESSSSDLWGDFNINSDDYAMIGYDCYKKDDPQPEIVLAAMNNDLRKVKKYIAKGRDLDKRRRWTEVEVKWGYNKDWEWFGDSALIVATKHQSVDIVKELLLNQADPMLKSCPSDDVYNTALEVAQRKSNKQILRMISVHVVNDLWIKLNQNCHESADYSKGQNVKNKPSRQVIKRAIYRYVG